MLHFDGILNLSAHIIILYIHIRVVFIGFIRYIFVYVILCLNYLFSACEKLEEELEKIVATMENSQVLNIYLIINKKPIQCTYMYFSPVQLVTSIYT